jgi:hypothetical protein
MSRLQAAVLFVLALVAVPAWAAETKVAVLDFDLIDTSLEGEMNGSNPAEAARLSMLAPRLRSAIAKEPGFASAGPLAATVRERPLDNCAKCVADLGREIGVDIVIIGTVQKVSNLILNINAYGHDVRTGKIVAGGSADIRGNNDEMWIRGIEALWRNTLKKQFQAIADHQTTE